MVKQRGGLEGITPKKLHRHAREKLYNALTFGNQEFVRILYYYEGKRENLRIKR